jgi:hypothetical protein
MMNVIIYKIVGHRLTLTSNLPTYLISNSKLG